MTQEQRDHFEAAIDDSPDVADGEVAEATTTGNGMRRGIRQSIAIGVGVGLVVVGGVVAGSLLPAGRPGSKGPVTVAAAMMPATAPSCAPQPVDHDAADVVISLDLGLTDGQRVTLATALRADPVVATTVYNSRNEVYERFRTRWAQQPDLLAAVVAEQFPEVFRVRLVAASQYGAVRERYTGMEGVAGLVGRRCPEDAPIGGIL